MYTLYWDRGNANMASHALLIELAQPYRLARVDLSKHEQRGPDYLAASAAAQAEVKTVAERRLDAMFSRIDSGLAEAGPHLLGERFSAADIYLVMLCRWARNLNKPATAYPAIGRLVDLVSARPAWAKMMAEAGITWDGRSA